MIFPIAAILGGLSKAAGAVAGLFAKRPWLIPIVVLSVGCVILFMKWRDAKADIAEAQLAGHQQVTLNETLQARLATTVAARDSFEFLFAAEQITTGELVAALRIAIAERDTVIKRDTIPTYIRDDSTRVAAFRDSTFAGIIDGEVTAPPFPAPLGIRYTVTRPAFTPEIGFLKLRDTFTAVVSWQGEEFQIEAPYFRPLPKKKGLLGAFADVYWYPVGFSQDENSTMGPLDIAGGALLRLPLNIQARTGLIFNSGGEVRPFVGGAITF